MALSLVLTACSGDTATSSAQPSGQAGGTGSEKILKLAGGGDPISLDTLKGTDGYSLEVLRMVNEGLGRYVTGEDGTDIVEPAGAETWETSEDGLTWTFHLRDYNWSDGQPVTADDYVYAFQRMFDPAVASSAGQLFLCLKNAQEILDGTKQPEEIGVSAPDEKTVVFELTSPTPYFESLIGMPSAFPQRKDIVEQYGDQYGTTLDTVVYNGPFTITEWTLGSMLFMSKNDTYWDAESVKLDGVQWNIITDETSAMIMLKNGDLHAYTASPQWTDEIMATGEFDLLESPFPAGMRDIFNVETPLLSSPKVRLAISLAKNREEINDAIYDGYYTPAYGWVMPAISCQGQNFRDAAGDPLKEAAEANPDLVALYKEGLKESGLDPDTVYTLEVLLQDSEASTRTAGELFKSQLESALPISVELVPCTDNTDFYQRRAEGNFQMTYLHMNGAEYDDPSVFLNMYLTGASSNEGNYSNEEYDKLILEAQNTTDPAKRLELFVEAEKIMLVDDPAISPTLYWAQNLYVSKKVSGLMVPAFVPVGGFEYKYADITE